MEIRADIAQLEQYNAQFANAITEATEDGLRASATVLQRQVKKNFGSEGGGVSSVEGGKNSYESAPPGAFPSVQTGHLRRSVQQTPVESLSVVVGTNVEYARYLEFGTSNMPARPFLHRSLSMARQVMADAFARTVKRSMTAKAKALIGRAGRAG